MAVLEIGSFAGLSTNIITYFMRKHGKTNPFYCCDPWRFEGSRATATLGDSTISHEEYRAFVRDTFIRNVAFFSRGALPHAIEMDAAEFFPAWDAGLAVTDVFGRNAVLGGRVGFAFIDGDHSYDAATRDSRGCDRWLEPGGSILFDDSSDDSVFDVPRVVREALATRRYAVLVRNPNYLLVRRA